MALRQCEGSLAFRFTDQVRTKHSIILRWNTGKADSKCRGVGVFREYANGAAMDMQPYTIWCHARKPKYTLTLYIRSPELGKQFI